MTLTLLFLKNLWNLLVYVIVCSYSELVNYPSNITEGFEIYPLRQSIIVLLEVDTQISVIHNKIKVGIHPFINHEDNVYLYLERTYCSYYRFSKESCLAMHAMILPHIEKKMVISLNVVSMVREFENFTLSWYFTTENLGYQLQMFCDEFNPISFQNCYDRINKAFMDSYNFYISDYYDTRCDENISIFREQSNIWVNVRSNVTVTSPPAYLIPIYKLLSNNTNLIFDKPIEELIDLYKNNDDIIIDTSHESKSESQNRLYSEEPSLHILITTTTKPQIFGMISSLQELTSIDYVTVVFDGSPEKVELQKEIKTYMKLLLKCQIRFYHEEVALGYFGHGARNKYNNLHGDYDFAIHADDDDVFTPNAITTIKKTCRDRNTLYLFKMQLLNGHSSRVIWDRKNVLIHMNVGTPCGVIPKSANTYGKWGMHYGGDAAFYMSLVPYVRHIEYVDFITYKYIKQTAAPH